MVIQSVVLTKEAMSFVTVSKLKSEIVVLNSAIKQKTSPMLKYSGAKVVRAQGVAVCDFQAMICSCCVAVARWEWRSCSLLSVLCIKDDKFFFFFLFIRCPLLAAIFFFEGFGVFFYWEEIYRHSLANQETNWVWGCKNPCHHCLSPGVKAQEIQHC